MRRTRSRRRDMKTTLMTFLRVAGSIGAAILVFEELDTLSTSCTVFRKPTLETQVGIGNGYVKQ